MKPIRPDALFTVLSVVLCGASAHGQDDEAAERRGLRLNAPGAFQGYTLFAPLRSREIYLVDMEGEVVHAWEDQDAPGGTVYMLDNGNLLRDGRLTDNPTFRGGGIGGLVQEIDWDGNVVWEYVMSDEFQTQHHDLAVLPNGNVLMIAWEHRYREDAIESGRAPAAVGEAGIWPDAVIEVRPTRPKGGEVVWEWHAWDHLIQDFDEEKAYYGSIPDHPERIDVNADHRDRAAVSEAERERLREMEEMMAAVGYVGDDVDAEEEDAEESADEGGGGAPAFGAAGNPDWLHTNSIDYNAEWDLIVLSTPRMNEIWVIDHGISADEAAWDDGGRWGRGGDLLYRWGNPRNYGAGAPEDQALFAQHDARWLPSAPGELRIQVFNNGGGRPDGNYSSVDELVLPFDPERGFLREAGQAFGPEEPAWSYSAGESFFAGFISGAQRLSNGNTLVCAGPEGRVFEVTREGEVVWDYLNPFEGDAAIGTGGNAPPVALFRATRLATDHPGLARLR